MTKFAAVLFTFALICRTAGPLLSAEPIVVPDWALPSSPTHKQVPPPPGFHRPSVQFHQPLGIFDGQADIGGPLLPGSASFNPGTKQYTLNSASYNIWYNRDEFRFAWKKMSGDISLAASITFPKESPPVDRKLVLIVRQDLDDDSKEVMAGLHGPGPFHLAYRPEKDANIATAYGVKATARPAGASPVRLGLEKRGDTFALYVSLDGEPMHQVGTTIDVPFKPPFYVGLGFCSHVPDKTDTGIASDVVLENSAGRIR